MRYLILALLAGCSYGLSAAQTTGYPDVYCQPTTVDTQVCRSDDGKAWSCGIQAGFWACRRSL